MVSKLVPPEEKNCGVSLAAQIMESFEASIQRLIYDPGTKTEGCCSWRFGHRAMRIPNATTEQALL